VPRAHSVIQGQTSYTQSGGLFFNVILTVLSFSLLPLAQSLHICALYKFTVINCYYMTFCRRLFIKAHHIHGNRPQNIYSKRGHLARRERTMNWHGDCKRRPVVEGSLELDGSDEYSRRDLVYDGTSAGGLWAGRSRLQRLDAAVQRSSVVVVVVVVQWAASRQHVLVLQSHIHQRSTALNH